MRRRDFIAGLGASTALLPRLTQAEQAGRIPLVAILWHAGSREEEGALYDAMMAGFTALGYVAGKNVRFEERFPGEIPGRFEQFAKELVALQPDVLVAVATPSILAAQKTTTTIPIVFLPPLDPVQLKLVKSLARPEGNLTGLTTIAEGVPGKRAQLLKRTFPDLSSLALMFDPVVAYNVALEVSETRLAAEKLGLAFDTFETKRQEDIDEVFSTIVQRRYGATIVTQGPMYFLHRNRMAKFALENKLILMGASDVFADSGYLMSYGPSWPPIFHNVATYVDKILKGAKPGDLPVQQPTIFEFIINLKTAKSVGLEVPPSALLLADRVIE
ncbi:ABC transporter substrate-binding protein [Bradyrhizobium sp.]|uniref:ABC transporter substrate-binding protein n=1 Tax=Bradyrhizobium sp. TaxID=376 RepID=UPI003C784A87